jgi:3-hydroxyisobutyrate dehydrogenase-like beta-hydroxyacid dehydrogenase|tara:strand:+ start:686 stop:1570 length:885 start_codon:yes stop_codon:yes gene_type:complete
MSAQEIKIIGFIGLGVMGHSMSQNILRNKGWNLLVKDLDHNKEKELENKGAKIADNIKDIFKLSDLVITCLPGGGFVEDLYFGKNKNISYIKNNQFIIDMSTSQPDLMIRLEDEIKIKGSHFADAPIARTRQAAIDGTLAIMVGSDKNTFNKILPVLKYMGNDIMHCGKVGSGQLTKILNNMILFETVVALSEAANIAENYGMDVKNLFENITNCSGDSFALRNHGLKSIAKNDFPSPAFSSEYALKDLSYALELGKKLDVKMPGALSAESLLKTSIKNGDKDLYFPVMKKYFN